MLTIEDLSLFKITKTKDWAIYFTYNNEKYLLHESSEYGECSTTLYKRIPTSKLGQYNLEHIHSCYGNAIPYINYKSKKRIKNHNSRTYNTINLNSLVWDMTWKGFFSGIYFKEIEERKEKIAEFDSVINTLNATKSKLRYI